MRIRIAAGLLVLVSIAGCGVGSSSPTPVTVLMVDVSGSTKGLIKDFGPTIKDAIVKTAEKKGQFWAASGDRAILANSSWTIDGARFKADDVGPALQADDLRVKGRKLAASPQAAALLKWPGRQGSDLLGMLQLAADVTSAHPDSPRSLVFLTDGGIHANGIDLIGRPPTTQAARTALIESLVSNGLIKKNSLGGTTSHPVNVYLCGVGRGAIGADGQNAQFVRDFWTDLIAEVGGTIKVMAPSCSNLEGLAG